MKIVALGESKAASFGPIDIFLNRPQNLAFPLGVLFFFAKKEGSV
jgi:hypothetical protein